MRNTLFLVLLAMVLSGCASSRHHTLYDGDPALRAGIQSFDTVMIRYIDDEDMGLSFIGQKQQYDIKAGQHTLLVEYSDIFQIDADQHDKVVSRPAKVTFVAEAGKQYQVQHPPQQRLNNAKAFAEKPEFWVVELGSGERVASQVELSRPRSFMTGLKSVNTPEYEFASDALSPGAAGASAAAASVAQGVTPAATAGAAGPSNLQMLQYSWKNASAEDRAAFLEWINSHKD